MNATVDIAPIVRRFELPDLDRHAKWVMPRLAAAFPHLNDRAIAGFLTSIIYQNDHMFLYLPHGVALAQVLSSNTLNPKPIIWEQFVWAEDPANKEHVAQAASFYKHFATWGRNMSVEVMIVGEMTDVPSETIKATVGRVFNRQQQFVRL